MNDRATDPSSAWCTDVVSHASTFVNDLETRSPNTTTLGWVPILSGDDALRARQVVDIISTALREKDVTEPGLGNGAPGVALFLAYLSTIQPESRWRQPASLLLRRAAENAIVGEHPRSFLHGATGVAWALEHIQREFGQDDVNDEPDFGPAIDHMLREQLAETPWRGVYELSHGLVGYGLYALERIDKPERRLLLEMVISRLQETALPSRHGVTWWTAPQNLQPDERVSYPAGYFNLGLAHGVPSVIALLGEACRLDVCDRAARALLTKAVHWLLAQRQPNDTGSSFGTVVPLGRTTPSKRSRVAWCFGDLGVSAALYSAARGAGHTEWEHEALHIARQTARRLFGDSNVKEATICHGAAGNGHLFNRFYQATGESVFLDAAREWLARALAWAPHTDTAPRYVDEQPDPSEEQEGWTKAPGIFAGLAGIGMVLLASICTFEPVWDRLLLLSMPPMPRAQLKRSPEVI